MSKAGLFAGSSLASKFPKVMALLTGARASDDDEQPGGEDGEDSKDESGDTTETGDTGSDQTNDGGDAGERQVDEDEGGAAATVIANGQFEANEGQRVALLSAFEADADRLVAQERERCIAVFTSDAGKRNPDGVAAVLRDTNMTAEKANGFLATFGGSSRTDARGRLNTAPETRVKTGAGQDQAGAKGSVVEKHRADLKKRNATVRGGRKVNAGTADETAD